jgi:uncharacterized protein YjgD (DUF1641 family)
MNFEQNKFGHPFNPGNSYFNDLSGRIQQRIGIEAIKLHENVEPKIEFAKKQRQAPVQLTVEFGYPLTAEKIEKENNNSGNEISAVMEVNLSSSTDETPSNHTNTITDIGEIHIEPIHLKPNATPYWHEFNADDELEGLVLDSDGQEMSEITINGDLAFDLDQQIFHEAAQIAVDESPIVYENITDLHSSPIGDEVFQKEEVQENQSPILDEIKNQIVSSENIVDEFSAVVIVENNQSLENPSLIIDSTSNEITSTEISNEISSEFENFNRESAIFDEVNKELALFVNGVNIPKDEDEFVPSFAFSFVPDVTVDTENHSNIALHDLKIEVVDVVSRIITQEISSIESVEEVYDTIVPQEIKNELTLNDNLEGNDLNVVTEMTFSDAELDSLHEQLTHQILDNQMGSELESNNVEEKGFAGEIELEFSDADLDLLHESMSNELPETEMVIHEMQTKPVVSKNENVYASSNSNIEAETVPFKPSMFDLIPWSSVFGILASLMAIASAWFIWNSIQKPIAIDEFIDKTIAPTVQVVAPVSNETPSVELNLSPSEYIASSIIEEANSPEQTENTFIFSNLSERSKVSAVELEKLGLTTLDLEDGFFEEPIF